jgi:ribosome maturation factor RimP
LSHLGDLRLCRNFEWASAHFFFDIDQPQKGQVTTGDRANERDTAPRTDGIQAEIESRLAATEPEVEVLAAEILGSRRSPMLRIYIDHPGGVDLDLCARVTHHLRDLLREYSVEVSSPGPERPLTKLDHYRRYLGRRVRVRTREAIEGRKDFKGELIGADDRGVALAAEWGTITIPHERIRRSSLMSQPPAENKRR